MLHGEYYIATSGRNVFGNFTHIFFLWGCSVLTVCTGYTHTQATCGKVMLRFSMFWYWGGGRSMGLIDVEGKYPPLEKELALDELFNQILRCFIVYLERVLSRVRAKTGLRWSWLSLLTSITGLRRQGLLCYIIHGTTIFWQGHRFSCMWNLSVFLLSLFSFFFPPSSSSKTHRSLR